MKADCYYEFRNGNRFKVIRIQDGLCHCRVVNRYEFFYLLSIDGDQMLFDNDLREISPPPKDLTIGAQIRGDQFVDRSID